VNRERIDEISLQGRDEVQIGKFRLVFLTGTRTPSPAADTPNDGTDGSDGTR
jgi:hypothetical protein